MDTVEDVPTTHANDATQATLVAEGPFESDTETAPSVMGLMLMAIRTWETWNTPSWER